MRIRHLSAALAICLTVTPSAAWAQRGGRGRLPATPAVRSAGPRVSAPRGRFHAPPAYIVRHQQIVRGFYPGFSTRYPYYYFSPGYFSPGYYFGPSYSFSPGGYLAPFPSLPGRAYPYGPVPTYPYGSAVVNWMTTSPQATSTSGPSAPVSIGGVSFAITPDAAAIFVDGVYVGTARDFSTTALPLSLAAGRHHFELRALGYETATVDLDVVPGQITPYSRQLAAVQPSGR